MIRPGSRGVSGGSPRATCARRQVDAANPPEAWLGPRALAAVAALALTGAGWSKKRSDPPPPKVEETIGNLAYIAQGSEIKLEGVGLVVGLDNTGVDPGPSYYRERLVDEMRKAGVENANKILDDPRFAMVIVRAKIPPGVDDQRPARRGGRAAPRLAAPRAWPAAT